MDTEIEEAVETCENAVVDLVEGAGNIEQVCIAARLLLFACSVARNTFASVLTNDLSKRIETLLSRANNVVRVTAGETKAASDRRRAARVESYLAQFHEIIGT